MTGGKSRARTVGAFVLMAVLAACGGGVGRGDGGAGARSESLESYTPDQIFERGEFELARSRTEDAAFYFAEIERLYPYSDWAKRALIMQAYAYHSERDYENSRVAAQRYIDFYPADEDAAYAQYLLALSYYDQIDEVGRDDGPGQAILFGTTAQFLEKLGLDTLDEDADDDGDLDLFVDPEDASILVLDNELPIYKTTIEDVLIRKSPYTKEMLNIRNIIKILKDSDVKISRKEASVKRVQKKSVDLLVR